MGDSSERRVLMGKVVGVFGVRGQLKIESYSTPRDQIGRYRPWLMGRDGVLVEIRPLDVREQSKTVVIRLPGCDSREQAELRLGEEIWIARSSLPTPAAGEYYWVDLEGLQVRRQDGRELGRISHMIATGANDVMVVHGERERLIPFTPGHAVLRVDIDAGFVEVDWDPDF